MPFIVKFQSPFPNLAPSIQHLPVQFHFMQHYFFLSFPEDTVNLYIFLLPWRPLLPLLHGSELQSCLWCFVSFHVWKIDAKYRCTHPTTQCCRLHYQLISSISRIESIFRSEFGHPELEQMQPISVCIL